MRTDEWIALATSGILAIMFMAMAIVLLTGRGAFLIAGYNTMPKKEKERYDSAALCKFFGKILLPIGLATPAIAVGVLCKKSWPVYAYVAFVLGMIVFAIVYVNTANRFKK